MDDSAAQLLGTINSSRARDKKLRNEIAKVQLRYKEAQVKLQQTQETHQTLKKNLLNVNKKLFKKLSELTLGEVKIKVQEEGRLRLEKQIDEKNLIWHRTRKELNGLTQSMLESNVAFSRDWNCTDLGIERRKALKSSKTDDLKKQISELEEELSGFLIQEKIYETALKEKSELEESCKIEENALLAKERELLEQSRNLDSMIQDMTKKRKHFKSSYANKETRFYKSKASEIENQCKELEKDLSLKLSQLFVDMKNIETDVVCYTKQQQESVLQKKERKENRILHAKQRISEEQLKLSGFSLSHYNDAKRSVTSSNRSAMNNNGKAIKDELETLMPPPKVPKLTEKSKEDVVKKPAAKPSKKSLYAASSTSKNPPVPSNGSFSSGTQSTQSTEIKVEAPVQTCVPSSGSGSSVIGTISDKRDLADVPINETSIGTQKFVFKTSPVSSPVQTLYSIPPATGTDHFTGVGYNFNLTGSSCSTAPVYQFKKKKSSNSDSQQSHNTGFISALQVYSDSLEKR